MFSNVSILPLEFWAPVEQNVPPLLNEREYLLCKQKQLKPHANNMD